LTTHPTSPEVQRLWAAFKEAEANERVARAAAEAALDACLKAIDAQEPMAADTLNRCFAAVAAAEKRTWNAYCAWRVVSPEVTKEEALAVIEGGIQPASQRASPTPPIRPVSQKVSLPQKVSPPPPQGGHLVRGMKRFIRLVFFGGISATLALTALFLIYAIGYALPAILTEGVRVPVGNIGPALLTAGLLWLLWRWSWGNLLRTIKGQEVAMPHSKGTSLPDWLFLAAGVLIGLAALIGYFQGVSHLR